MFDTWMQNRDRCLEMSLARGLDELGRLKHLELLDISDMRCQLGVPKLEWMMTN